METIQVVLDKKLLQAVDRAARQSKRNRSALVQDALRDYLHRLEITALAQRDRQEYLKRTQDVSDALRWEEEAAWPE